MLYGRRTSRIDCQQPLNRTHPLTHMGQREKPLDATIDIVTPENISFRYRVAGPFRRLPAFFIDVLLRFGVWMAIAFILGLLGAFQFVSGGLGLAMMLILMFVMEWLYGGILETYWNGQTVGKRVMGIRVLSVDGQPINGLQAMMRNILRYADMMPLIPLSVLTEQPSPFPIPTFVIGLVAPLLNSRFQRLGDLVCGTMVVIEEKSFLLDAATLEDPRVAQLAAELPHGFNVSRTMAKALATYVDRRQLFSPPRRREIARHIGEPLVTRFGLPADTSYDLLLCSLYHRTFLGTEDEEVVIPETYLSNRQFPVENRGSIVNVLPTPSTSASVPPNATTPPATTAPPPRPASGEPS